MAKHAHNDPTAKPAADQRRDDPHGLGKHVEHNTEEAKSLPHGDREEAETAPLRKGGGKKPG